MPPEPGGTPVEAEGPGERDGDATSASAVRARLEEQIARYDANSEKNRTGSGAQDLPDRVAAAIRVAAATSAPVWLMGGGAL
jgi:hypothetical protein